MYDADILHGIEISLKLRNLVMIRVWRNNCKSSNIATKASRRFRPHLYLQWDKGIDTNIADALLESRNQRAGETLQGFEAYIRCRQYLIDVIIIIIDKITILYLKKLEKPSKIAEPFKGQEVLLEKLHAQIWILESYYITTLTLCLEDHAQMIANTIREYINEKSK